jgi:hypothetical protein
MVRKYKLLASAGTIDGIRELIKRYWCTTELVSFHVSSRPNVFEVYRNPGMTFIPTVRVVKRGDRYRFEHEI